MQLIHVQTLAAQDAGDLARSHERVLQMDLVGVAHERQLVGAGWPGQAVNRTAAPAWQTHLLGGWGGVVTENHHVALSNPALVSALPRCATAV